jgi:predicted SprT family Zn-dependent metalloprotease
MAIVNRKFLRLPNSFLRPRIKYFENEWAWAHPSGLIEFNIRYPNYQFFRNVVAHEMIHEWQFFNGYTTDLHGASFFSWKTAMENFGYEIKHRY